MSTISNDPVQQLVDEMATDLGIAPPKHSHDPKSSMTYCLNVARRLAMPYIPRHENDYMVITAGDRVLDGVTAHANGTHVCTIKVVKP